MIETIEVTGFYLSTSGDRNAGIFPANYKIEGHFSFYSGEELETFKSELGQLFADHVTSEKTSVQTFEERKEQLRKEQEFFNQQP